jgi:chaperonin GroEL
MSKIKGDLLKQKKGIDFVVDAVKITIGPRGKNVSLSNGDTVNDARRVAEDIVLKDPTENKGANKVRNKKEII